MLCLLSFMPCCLCVKESASYYIAYFLELTQQKKNREIVKESASYCIAYFLELTQQKKIEKLSKNRPVTI